ncbi:hypothetical protein EYC84_004741 [Monilinia fructicola]|uniref:Uncharacterized protein n=1 Tax=Monilinia fructicola TaxID=38448 RepID=A0A5M9K1D5_MONFR|nr:hypothetical protein EYC84_004741 [Monilinia fructicola]
MGLRSNILKSFNPINTTYWYIPDEEAMRPRTLNQRELKGLHLHKVSRSPEVSRLYQVPYLVRHVRHAQCTIHP